MNGLFKLGFRFRRVRWGGKFFFRFCNGLLQCNFRFFKAVVHLRRFFFRFFDLLHFVGIVAQAQNIFMECGSVADDVFHFYEMHRTKVFAHVDGERA